MSSFGLIVVSARTQQLSVGRVTGSDYAPASGRSVYATPGQASFADPTGDHDAAPDITSISVSDTPAGMVEVRESTPNYPTLPADKIIGVDFDLAGRPAAADDVFVACVSGSGLVQVDIEEHEILAPSKRAKRSRRLGMRKRILKRLAAGRSASEWRRPSLSLKTPIDD